MQKVNHSVSTLIFIADLGRKALVKILELYVFLSEEWLKPLLSSQTAFISSLSLVLEKQIR